MLVLKVPRASATVLRLWWTCCPRRWWGVMCRQSSSVSSNVLRLLSCSSKASNLGYFEVQRLFQQCGVAAHKWLHCNSGHFSARERQYSPHPQVHIQTMNRLICSPWESRRKPHRTCTLHPLWRVKDLTLKVWEMEPAWTKTEGHWHCHATTKPRDLLKPKEIGSSWVSTWLRLLLHLILTPKKFIVGDGLQVRSAIPNGLSLCLENWKVIKQSVVVCQWSADLTLLKGIRASFQSQE